MRIETINGGEEWNRRKTTEMVAANNSGVSSDSARQAQHDNQRDYDNPRLAGLTTETKGRTNCASYETNQIRRVPPMMRQGKVRAAGRCVPFDERAFLPNEAKCGWRGKER